MTPQPKFSSDVWLLLLLFLPLLQGCAAGYHTPGDSDEVDYIPKYVPASPSTTTASPSRASHLPNILTSLEIPPAYLEEILRPEKPPYRSYNDHHHQLLYEPHPQQENSQLYGPPDGHESYQDQKSHGHKYHGHKYVQDHKRRGQYYQGQQSIGQTQTQDQEYQHPSYKEGGKKFGGQYYNGVKDHRDQKPPYQHYQGQKNQSQNSGSQGDSKSRDKETNYGGVYTGGASPSGGIYTGGVYTGDASSPGGVYTGGVYTGGVYTSDIYSGSNDVNYDNTKTPGSKSQWSWDSSHEKETEDNFALHEGVESTSQGPRFDRSLPRKVTVQAGKTAVLACRVLDSTEKSQVSWMRHEDLHILSVGKYKYSTDDRVTVSREEERQEWVLTIEKVTEEDAGMYECQVSAKPVLSFIVSLEVVVPRAEVVHGPEIFVHRGSLINLTCVVTHGTQRPVYVYWYHHNKVLDYEGRGGVTVITKASTNTISHLLMRDARPEDSGVYSCRPSNGEDASATLHVLNGEHQAAMQSDASPRMFTSAFVITFGLCLICVVQLYRSNIDGAP